jgi:hypothetical protein
MKADVVRLNPTKETLNQIVQEAIPILKVLGFEIEGEPTPKARTKSVSNLEQLVQKMQIPEMDPHILWK